MLTRTLRIRPSNVTDTPLKCYGYEAQMIRFRFIDDTADDDTALNDDNDDTDMRAALIRDDHECKGNGFH